MTRSELTPPTAVQRAVTQTAAKRHGMSRYQVASGLTTVSRHVAGYPIGDSVRPAA